MDNNVKQPDEILLDLCQAFNKHREVEKTEDKGLRDTEPYKNETDSSSKR